MYYVHNMLIYIIYIYNMYYMYYTQYTAATVLTNRIHQQIYVSMINIQGTYSVKIVSVGELQLG